MNNNIFQKSISVHKKEEIKETEKKENVNSKENKIKKAEDKENIKNQNVKTSVNPGDIRKILEIKQEMYKIKSSLFKNTVILITVPFIIILIFNFTILNKINTKKENFSINNKNIYQKYDNELKDINKKLQILADNQKIINKKIMAVYEIQKATMNQIQNNVQTISGNIADIHDYLKTEGKIIEILSKMIMNNNIKLEKIIDKIFQKQNNIKTENKIKIKQEIQKETDNLTKKYENLLKELK